MGGNAITTIEVKKEIIEELFMGVNQKDINKPFIRVSAFKDSGKWYATKSTVLDTAHAGLINANAFTEFCELIKSNAKHVQKYSPLSTHFSNTDMQFVIEGFNLTGFCYGIIKPKELNMNFRVRVH